MRITSVIILLFYSLSWAEPDSYVNAKAMKERGIDVAGALKAKVSVENSGLGFRTSLCTGFLISHTGYIMSSLHCLGVCLKGELKDLTTAKNEGLGVSTVKVGDTLKGKKCEGLKITGPNGMTTDVTIVATGKSFVIRNETDFNEVIKFEDYRNASLANDRSEDYVVLKIPSDKKSLSCVQINESPVPVNETIWSYRFESPGPDLEKQFVIGKRVSGSKVARGEKLIFGEYIYTDMKVVAGNSGGPALDEYGKVRGLVTNGGPYPGIYPISVVRKALETQLSKQEIDEIFNCPQKDWGNSKGSTK